MERSIKSVANVTHRDGIEFLKIADELKLKSRIELYAFDDIPEILMKVSKGEINGTAVATLES
jgi:propanol-preferring alcohol dehydrogenase